MRFLLPSRLLGTITAAAVALTSFTALPAHADDERAVRAIATILGIAAIGAIIHENRKDDKHHDVYRQQQVHKPRHVQPQVHHRQHVQPRPLPQRVDRAFLPQNCLRSYQTRQGQAHMFGQRCLERNYRAVHRLPQNCAIRVRTHDGARSGFDAQCLHRSGYRLARY